MMRNDIGPPPGAGLDQDTTLTKAESEELMRDCAHLLYGPHGPQKFAVWVGRHELHGDLVMVARASGISLYSEKPFVRFLGEDG